MNLQIPPRRWLIVLLAACLPACSGGAKLNEVKGKVTYKGEPLAGALVTFHPKATNIKATPPTGLTGPDGTFTAVTGQDSGAPDGEYIVTVICSVKPQGAKPVGMSMDVDTVDKLGGAYANRDSSRISVTIKPGKNQLDPFDLK